MSSGTSLKTKTTAPISDPNKRKRERTDTSEKVELKDATCCFCAQTPAALNVKLPVLGRKKRADMPYCLQCYYTSSAVRQGEQNVSILNKQEQERQLPAMQTMFSKCFLELQRDISKESIDAFSKRPKNHDPLAALLGTGISKMKKRPPPLKAGNHDDGGFLRNVDIPERLKKTQQQQLLARSEERQLARIEQTGTKNSNIESRNNDNLSVIAPINRYAISSSSTLSNRRRKGSGKSIWNLAMDPTSSKNDKNTVSHITATQEEDTMGVTCSSCGNKDVKSFGNITSRNGDVRKGEIWGTDRDSTVVTRYQCNNCGRTWNEEE
ncbi:hypothetical protein IV203_034860 [Nitzschia inconspicua]|uniref:Uncharacterized protein n=1 Tax=Nitzschia inconspicua TaxID=303405 RepID=A0A9K3LCS0_9STRA|nr:hypothetical protein IV203_034860 [Nitzschia inconspicua]